VALALEAELELVVIVFDAAEELELPEDVNVKVEDTDDDFT
jgi:hypothetical protein